MSGMHTVMTSGVRGVGVLQFTPGEGRLEEFCAGFPNVVREMEGTRRKLGLCAGGEIGIVSGDRQDIEIVSGDRQVSEMVASGEGGLRDGEVGDWGGGRPRGEGALAAGEVGDWREGRSEEKGLRTSVGLVEGGEELCLGEVKLCDDLFCCALADWLMGRLFFMRGRLKVEKLHLTSGLLSIGRCKEL
jgi:hypothetical protein